MPPLGGLEPPTFRLTAERANRLRHRGTLYLRSRRHINTHPANTFFSSTHSITPHIILTCPHHVTPHRSRMQQHHLIHIVSSHMHSHLSTPPQCTNTFSPTHTPLILPTKSSVISYVVAHTHFAAQKSHTMSHTYTQILTRVAHSSLTTHFTSNVIENVLTIAQTSNSIHMAASQPFVIRNEHRARAICERVIHEHVASQLLSRNICTRCAFFILRVSIRCHISRQRSAIAKCVVRGCSCIQCE